MKSLILVVLIALAAACTRAAEISLTAKVIRSGYFESQFAGDSKTGSPAWLVSAEIQNLSSKLTEVGFMSSSWYNSFTLEPGSAFSVPGWACTVNYQTLKLLASGEKISFRFPVILKKGGHLSEGQRLKIGFIFQKLHPPARRKFGDLFEPDPVIVWSKEIGIPKVGSHSIKQEETVPE